MQKRGVPVTQDSWDGYPVQRQAMYDMFLQNTNNLVILSGDTHNAWAFDHFSGDTRVGVEFGTPSVTSSGYEDLTIPLWNYLGTLGFAVWRDAWKVTNPKTLVYNNALDRGFAMIRFNKTHAAAEYFYISPTGSPYTRSNVYPYGTGALNNATFDPNAYYCEPVYSTAGSRAVSIGSTCLTQFGQGLDPLIGAINIVGSPAAPLHVSALLGFFLLFLASLLLSC
jgi:hypothetical protein